MASDPFSAAAGLAGGIASSYMNNEANKKEAKRQRAFDDQQAKRQMDFQERMSSSAHQREVKDLQAAGLNPLLGIGGAGSSSPTGASAQAQIPNLENVLGKGITSALEFKSMQQGIKKQEEDIKLTQATTKKTNVEALVAEKGIPEAEAKNYFWNKAKEAAQKVPQMYQEAIEIRNKSHQR